MNQSEYKNDISELRDELYTKYGDKKEITDCIGNYCSQTIGLISILESEELFNRSVGKLNDLLLEKLSLDDFIKLRYNESKKLNKLISSVINEEGELTKEDKKNIITKFKNFTNNL